MLRIQQWVCAGLILAAAAVNCAAQSTGTPVFQAPYRAFGRSEIGISLSDPGSGFALEGSVRGGISPTTDLGVRGGFRSFSGRNSETDVLLGVDLRVRMGTHSESFPLDISGTVGLGLESGHGFTTGRLPLGLSMGRRLRVEGSGISLVPYVQPVLTFFFGDASGSDLSFGFGLDARMNRRLDLRVSAAVGDMNGVGFTVAFLH